MKAILFSKDSYSRDMLDHMTDYELNGTMLEDASNTFAYDDIKSFETDLNDGIIDVKNNYVKFVKD